MLHQQRRDGFVILDKFQLRDARTGIDHALRVGQSEAFLSVDLGVRIKTLTGLCRKSKAHPGFNRAERAKGDLDPLLVAPADVVVELSNELFGGRAFPVPRAEQLILQPTEKPLAGCVVRRACLAGHGAGEIGLAHS